MRLKMSKRTIASLFSVVMMATAIAPAKSQALDQIKSSGEVAIGWAEWRPLEYRDTASGELKGVLIAFAEEIAKKLDAKPKFIQDNWLTMTMGIESDKFQIALMGISESRTRVVNFSTPLYYVPYGVVVKSNSGLKTFDEVNQSGNSIAVTTGSSTDELLTLLEKSGDLKAQIVRLKDVGGALLSLTSGKSTAFATTLDALAQIAEQQKSLIIAEGSFGATDYAIAHPKGDEELTAVLDKAVSDIIEEGTAAKLLETYAVLGSVVGAHE